MHCLADSVLVVNCVDKMFIETLLHLITPRGCRKSLAGSVPYCVAPHGCVNNHFIPLHKVELVGYNTEGLFLKT